MALLLVLVLAVSYLIAVKPVSCSAVAAVNTWTQKAPMQQARSSLGVAVVNNKIYAIGGVAGSGNYVGTNEEYDPETDTWTFKKPMPTPRYGFAIAVYKNKIYCMGGVTINYEGDHYLNTTQVNEVYDPATDNWENKSPIPNNPRSQALVIGSKIYLVSLGYPNGTYNELRVYDPATDSWNTKTPMPPPPNVPFGFASVVIDNKIYAMYGFYNGASDAYESKTEIYDPTTDRWSSGAPVPSIHWIEAAGATTGIMAPKRIYVFGGSSELILARSELASFAQVYNPKYDYWINSSAVPTNRISFGVAVVNDTLFAVGGYTADYPVPSSDIPQRINYSALNEQYIPAGHGTPDPSYEPPDITPPEVAVVSPENKTYEIFDVPLNFTINESVSQIKYSLNGEDNVTIAGNTTLANVTYGDHKVTVYATDNAGNTGASETITFTVSKPPEPFPVAPVAAASGVSVAIIGAGILLYFKKRKQ